MKKLVMKKENGVVSGIRIKFLWYRVLLTILILAIKHTRHPVKAYKLLHSLINERLNLHDNKGEIKTVKSGSRYYWSVDVPGWPSKNFNHFIINEFLRITSPGQSTLQTIIFAITNICPLNCVHCYESDNLFDKNRLSLEDLKVVMTKICNAGIKHIQFSGGEPLSRFDDMISLMSFSGNSIDYWINTSGYGLTLDKASIMKQKGMLGAIISLDDWDENRHNNFRKNNKSFYWVKEAVKNCNKAGIIVCLSICPVKEFVTEQNLNQYHLLAKELGAGFIRILEPRKVGRFSGKDILLDSLQIGIIDNFMVFRNRNPEYNKYPIIQYPGHHQRKLGCLGAGNRYIYIDSNGDFHSCPFCRKPLGSAILESIDNGISKAMASGCHAFKQRAII
jgi:MoaA/NifB/PqqE/SkfB family radical SAM enzyme